MDVFVCRIREREEKVSKESALRRNLGNILDEGMPLVEICECLASARPRSCWDVDLHREDGRNAGSGERR